jgi:hypothetical protein
MCAQRAVVATRGATGRIMRAGATHWEATAAFILVNVSHNVECERMLCFFRVYRELTPQDARPSNRRPSSSPFQPASD